MIDSAMDGLEEARRRAGIEVTTQAKRPAPKSDSAVGVHAPG
ncbi:MAG: hypothetical protein OXE53_18490 [Deltaproteobacteria bacterium]|nr:hypothetical protein [Deltaproteobacteria bacterium]